MSQQISSPAPSARSRGSYGFRKGSIGSEERDQAFDEREEPREKRGLEGPQPFVQFLGAAGARVLFARGGVFARDFVHPEEAALGVFYKADAPVRKAHHAQREFVRGAALGAVIGIAHVAAVGVGKGQGLIGVGVFARKPGLRHADTLTGGQEVHRTADVIVVVARVLVAEEEHDIEGFPGFVEHVENMGSVEVIAVQGAGGVVQRQVREHEHGAQIALRNQRVQFFFDIRRKFFDQEFHAGARELQPRKIVLIDHVEVVYAHIVEAGFGKARRGVVVVALDAHHALGIGIGIHGGELVADLRFARYGVIEQQFRVVAAHQHGIGRFEAVALHGGKHPAEPLVGLRAVGLEIGTGEDRGVGAVVKGGGRQRGQQRRRGKDEAEHNGNRFFAYVSHKLTLLFNLYMKDNIFYRKFQP